MMLVDQHLKQWYLVVEVGKKTDFAVWDVVVVAAAEIALSAWILSAVAAVPIDDQSMTAAVP